MYQCIKNNKSLVVWPVSTDDKIDINDMILMGLSTKDIRVIIEQHTYSGLMALAKFNEWKKVSIDAK